MTRHLLIEKPLSPWEGKQKAYLIGLWLTPDWNSAILDAYNVELLPYHWDDRSKLDRDINYIKKIIEDFLFRLGDELNRVHGVNHSKTYWRILLGEWLYLFIQVTFDRWETLRFADENHGARLLTDNVIEELTPPPTIIEFLESIKNPRWNSVLISNINFLINNQSLPANHKNECISTSIKTTTQTHHRGKFEFVKFISKPLYMQLNRFKPMIQLSSTYLTPIDEIKLGIKLRTFPLYLSKFSYKPHLKIVDRSAIKLDGIGDDKFQKLLSALIPKMLPASYLEAYEYYSQKVGNEIEPPIAIVTANDFSGNESWKFRTANSVELGSKLIILQHGGLYGINHKSLMQDYEVSIADTYFSWGWTDKEFPNILIAPATKLIRKNIGIRTRKRENAKNLTLVTFEMPLMSYWLASMPIGPQVKEATEIAFEIVSTLKNVPKKDIKIRTFPQNFGLNQLEKFSKLLGKQAISDSKESFEGALRRSKLVVCTYNSTTFIESMSNDIPTVICWQPKYWEVTQAAQLHFDKLLACGVMFHSPSDCVEFVESSWSDISGWWNSPSVKDAVNSFLNFYGYTGMRKIGEISEKISLVIK